MDALSKTPRSSRRRTTPRLGGWNARFGGGLPIAFVLVSLVFGGTGASYPLAGWLVFALGAAVLLVRLRGLSWQALDQRHRLLVWLFAATTALLLIQVVPVPQSVWQVLPGHALAAQVAATAGVNAWTAWSLAPDRTLSALTGLVPPAAMMLIAVQSTSDQRRALLRLVLGFALVSAALAIVQLGAGPDSAPVLFASDHRGFGTGFFVNRNHFALFLLLAMLIAALPGMTLPIGKVENPRAAEWGLRVAAIVLLTLGVLSSLSRAGFFLLAITLVAAAILSRQGKVRLPLLCLGVVGAALLAFALRAAPPVQRLLERFATSAEDARFQYWGNTLDAARDALPLGTGFGTFTLVYPTYEPLNQVFVRVANHAHNDLLELVLEGGLPAVVLLCAWLAMIGYLVVHARRAAANRFERLASPVVALGVLVTLAASAVDYPVRMSTIAVVLALLIGLLLPRIPAAAPSDPEPRPSGGAWFIALPLLLLALFGTLARWSAQLSLAGQEVAAAAIAPWSSDSAADAATHYEMFGQSEASSRMARRALALSPLNAAALRAEGMAALATGRAPQGAALLSIGARLGWRDTITQLWLAQQALAAGASSFAVQRMDAVMRQEKYDTQLLPLLPPLLHTAQGRAALADQLAYRPGWRTAFFNNVARDDRWTLPELSDLAARLSRAGTPLAPFETALIRAVLLDHGRAAETRAVWFLGGGQGEVGDGEFESAVGELPSYAPPYAWRASPLVGVIAAVDEPDAPRRGNALSIQSDGVAQGVAVYQTVALPSGRYSVRLSASAQDAALVTRVGLAIACRPRTGTAASAPAPVTIAWARAGADWSDGTARFTVPAGCPAQDLLVSIPATSARPFGLWIDGVSIRREGESGA